MNPEFICFKERLEDGVIDDSPLSNYVDNENNLKIKRENATIVRI